MFGMPIRRLWFLMILLTTHAHAEILRVRKGAVGPPDGATWVTAFDELADALARSSAGDQIWVAEGTYAPVILREGVTILGGFTGVESDAAARDPRTAKAAISGNDKRQCVVSGEVVHGASGAGALASPAASNRTNNAARDRE